MVTIEEKRWLVFYSIDLDQELIQFLTYKAVLTSFTFTSSATLEVTLVVCIFISVPQEWEGRRTKLIQRLFLKICMSDATGLSSSLSLITQSELPT